MYLNFKKSKILLFGSILCCSFILKAQNNNNIDSAQISKLSVSELFIPYQPQIKYFNPNYNDLPQDPASFMKPISFKPVTLMCLDESCKNYSPKQFLSPFTQNFNLNLINNPTFCNLPDYTQGFFCDFEDHINRDRLFRIDFSVK